MNKKKKNIKLNLVYSCRSVITSKNHTSRFRSTSGKDGFFLITKPFRCVDPFLCLFLVILNRNVTLLTGNVSFHKTLNSRHFMIISINYGRVCWPRTIFKTKKIEHWKYMWNVSLLMKLKCRTASQAHWNLEQLLSRQ